MGGSEINDTQEEMRRSMEFRILQTSKLLLLPIVNTMRDTPYDIMIPICLLEADLLLLPDTI